MAQIYFWLLILTKTLIANSRNSITLVSCFYSSVACWSIIHSLILIICKMTSLFICLSLEVWLKLLLSVECGIPVLSCTLDKLSGIPLIFRQYTNTRNEIVCYFRPNSKPGRSAQSHSTASEWIWVQSPKHLLLWIEVLQNFNFKSMSFYNVCCETS